MMLVRPVILSAAVVALWSATSFGAICTDPVADLSQRAQAGTDRIQPQDLSTSTSLADLYGEAGTWSLDHVQPLDVPSVAPDASEPSVRSLPPGPNSATLFLCALGSLGAWQLGRSARRIDLGATPSWFHSGAPAQIGHVVVFDLDVTSLPVCHDVADQSDRSRNWHRRAGDVARVCESQSYLATIAPRGPPMMS